MIRDDVLAFLRRRALKAFIWTAGVTIALMSLMTVYFYIGGIEWGDWTVPDEEEMRLELRDVPDEENAYLALRALTNLYRVAERDWDSDCDNDEILDKDFVHYYRNPFFVDGDEEDFAKWTIVRSDPSSPERAARILADNAEFFEGFRAALKRKGFVNVDAREGEAKRIKEGKPPWFSYLPLYRRIVDFSQLLSMRAQFSLENGDVETAVSDIVAIHSLGQKILANSESFVEYLAGALIEKFSLTKMCDVVAMGKADDETIKRFETMLEVSEANAPMAWERGMKCEIAKHFENVEWVCDNPEFMFNWLFWCQAAECNLVDKPTRPLLGRIMAHWPGFAKFAFHRRKMMYHQAMLARAMLAGDDALAAMILHKISYNRLLPNGFGDWVQISFCPNLSPYLKNGCIDRLRPRIALASEKWRRAHGGENPPTLDVLVPDYLATVPRDPWSKSGEPMKYDAALGVVWSVGKSGEYDYRKIAEGSVSLENDSQEVRDTRNFAFRLDGRPIEFFIAADGTTTNPQ